MNYEDLKRLVKDEITQREEEGCDVAKAQEANMFGTTRSIGKRSFWIRRFPARYTNKIRRNLHLCEKS